MCTREIGFSFPDRAGESCKRETNQRALATNPYSSYWIFVCSGRGYWWSLRLVSVEAWTRLFWKSRLIVNPPPLKCLTNFLCLFCLSGKGKLSEGRSRNAGELRVASGQV